MAVGLCWGIATENADGGEELEDETAIKVASNKLETYITGTRTRTTTTTTTPSSAPGAGGSASRLACPSELARNTIGDGSTYRN